MFHTCLVISALLASASVAKTPSQISPLSQRGVFADYDAWHHLHDEVVKTLGSLTDACNSLQVSPPQNPKKRQARTELLVQKVASLVSKINAFTIRNSKVELPYPITLYLEEWRSKTSSLVLKLQSETAGLKTVPLPGKKTAPLEDELLQILEDGGLVAQTLEEAEKRAKTYKEMFNRLDTEISQEPNGKRKKKLENLKKELQTIDDQNNASMSRKSDKPTKKWRMPEFFRFDQFSDVVDEAIISVGKEDFENGVTASSEDEPELARLLPAIHRHEGNQSLIKVVEQLLSRKSFANIGWTTLLERVPEFVEACGPCVASKQHCLLDGPKRKSQSSVPEEEANSSHCRHPPKDFSVGRGPFDVVHVDSMPMVCNESHQGAVHVVTLMDSYSSMVKTLMVHGSVTSSHVVRLLSESQLSLDVVPGMVVKDNGTEGEFADFAGSPRVCEEASLRNLQLCCDEIRVQDFDTYADDSLEETAQGVADAASQASQKIIFDKHNPILASLESLRRFFESDISDPPATVRLNARELLRLRMKVKDTETADEIDRLIQEYGHLQFIKDDATSSALVSMTELKKTIEIDLNNVKAAISDLLESDLPCVDTIDSWLGYLKSGREFFFRMMQNDSAVGEECSYWEVTDLIYTSHQLELYHFKQVFYGDDPTVSHEEIVLPPDTFENFASMLQHSIVCSPFMEHRVIVELMHWSLTSDTESVSDLAHKLVQNAPTDLKWFVSRRIPTYVTGQITELRAKLAANIPLVKFQLAPEFSKEFKSSGRLPRAIVEDLICKRTLLRKQLKKLTVYIYLLDMEDRQHLTQAIAQNDASLQRLPRMISNSRNPSSSHSGSLSRSFF